MSRKLVRIKCRPLDMAELYGYDIMLEAVLDGDQLVSMPWLGIASFQGMYPFKLHSDGRMDFGSAWERDYRYWKTTIFKKPIRSGEVFSIIGIDDDDKKRECMYAIRDVQTLLLGRRHDDRAPDFELGDGSELDLDDPDVCHAISMAKRD